MSELLFEYKVRAKHRLGFKEFSFYATTDIEEFLNRNSIDYVRNMTDTVENRLFKEIERLNNIINELEKELDRGYRDLFEHELVPGRELITNIKNYLQELKGSDKK